MAGLTLLEASKGKNIDILTQAVIELYTGSSDLLANLPFRNIQGNAFSYNRDASYPNIGWRGINESYTSSVGVINPQTESLAIAGGDLLVDKALLKYFGDGERSIQEAKKVKALSLAWTAAVINGNSQTDPRVFDGLKVRVTGDQLIASGSSANGTALPLSKLDEAIDQVDAPTHIIMNKKMRRRMNVAAKTAAIGGNIIFQPNSFGVPVMTYNGLPILTLDIDHQLASIMPFTEACTSGTATGTSVYVVSMRDDGFCGIQNGTPEVRDLGELQTAPQMCTRVEWHSGIAIFSGRAVARVYSIADATITA